MKRRWILVALAIACLAPQPASASSIGVYFDVGATDCDHTLTSISPITWYIFAKLEGDAAAAGITGAYFRQTGIPVGWFINPAPNPAATIPVGPGIPEQYGLLLSFPTCQTGPAVLLFTVSGFASTVVGPTCLSIEAPDDPFTFYPCPTVWLCDAPTFTAMCVSGTSGVINENCSTYSCALAVEKHTWAGVKQIYQN